MSDRRRFLKSALLAAFALPAAALLAAAPAAAPRPAARGGPAADLRRVGDPAADPRRLDGMVILDGWVLTEADLARIASHAL